MNTLHGECVGSYNYELPQNCDGSSTHTHTCIGLTLHAACGTRVLDESIGGSQFGAHDTIVTYTILVHHIEHNEFQRQMVCARTDEIDVVIGGTTSLRLIF